MVFRSDKLLTALDVKLERLKFTILFIIASGVTDRGQGCAPPSGEVNVKTRSPLSLYFGI